MGLLVQTAGQTYQDLCSSLSKGMPFGRFTLRKSLLSYTVELAQRTQVAVCFAGGEMRGDSCPVFVAPPRGIVFSHSARWTLKPATILSERRFVIW
jgi:hypothetical protein